MSVRNRLFAAFSILFFSGCAAVNMPEGGPSDQKKPTLKSISPADGTTNFTGKTITLEFDEDVRPKDMNKELIITPNTGNTYNVRNDRQKIILEFNKPLEKNTTYFLSFRNGIEDITEGNKASEVSLSFSTGNYLDTARVSGKVVDYLTEAPENNLTVALYPESDTSNIRDHKPYYFTRTNADGSFRLQNIKNGNYWIFAHNDKNANETYDQEDEKIGYFTKPLAVNPKADSVILKTIRLDTRKPFVLSIEKALDVNTLLYNEGIESLSFRNMDKGSTERKLLWLPNETGKRISVYPENGALPAAILAISRDSSGNQGIDTVKFALANKAAIPARLNFRTDQTELQQNTLNQIKITFPVPINITGNNPFKLREDTLNTITPSYPKDYTLNPTKTELVLNYTPKAKKVVELILDTTQLIAINGKPFQKQTSQFSISSKATTGSITGTVKTNYKNYTVELLNDKNQVIKTEKNIRKLSYQNMEPGNYTVRVKIDENNDGSWKLGDKKLKTMPEKIYRYPKPVTVRANWEIENIDLIF